MNDRSHDDNHNSQENNTNNQTHIIKLRLTRQRRQEQKQKQKQLLNATKYNSQDTVENCEIQQSEVKQKIKDMIR